MRHFINVYCPISLNNQRIALIIAKVYNFGAVSTAAISIFSVDAVNQTSTWGGGIALRILDWFESSCCRLEAWQFLPPRVASVHSAVYMALE